MKKLVSIICLLLTFTINMPAQNVDKLFKEGKALYEAKNYAQAFPKLKLAAEKGHKKAQYRLGRCYEKGRGVAKDEAVAFQWYTKSAAKELAPMGIRVNAVAPGIVKTERFEELYEATGEKIEQRIGRIALGRLGTPADVANACAFLASDRADYISGQILGVDGCASI